VGGWHFRIENQELTIRKALQQLQFLHADLSAIVLGRRHRWFTMWLTHGSAPGLLRYRLSRCIYLVVGETFTSVRVLLWPVFFLLRIIGPPLDISYRADIGPGLRVLHPWMGVLVSMKTVCGRGLIMTGGNWIIMKERFGPGDIVIGDDAVLHANAIVMGPIRVGDGCVIGAGAVVMNDCAAGSTMVGAPARRLDRDDPAAAIMNPREVYCGEGVPPAGRVGETPVEYHQSRSARVKPAREFKN
jgi:serine acetyltransferase